MTALVVDDSRLARAEMRRLLTVHPDINVIGEAADTDEAERALRDHEPDLIFLDIELPGRSGLEWLASLDRVPMVIFCTAYSEFAVEAFERNALDYVVKPVQPDRLARSLDRARHVWSQAKPQKQVLGAADRVFVKDGDNCWFIKLADVRLFEIEGNYTRLYFGDQKALIPKTLNQLEARLDPEAFFRTSRQHIVNLQWVKSIDPSVAGGLELTLKDGRMVEVSRRQTQKFREATSL